MSIGEVALCAGHKVLIEAGWNSLLIVHNPEGILDQQLRPYPIHLLNNNFKLLNNLISIEY